MTPTESPAAQLSLLTRAMIVSLCAAVLTIALKAAAAVITGSVGFLSDAVESVVNLVAAAVALWAVRVSSSPPDAEHHFGHGNAEYLSAAVEGTMIFVAATSIVWTAVQRLVHPSAVEQAGWGLLLSSVASVINLAVGWWLVRLGRAHRSITLEADGRHLLTDVVTSVGVLVGIVLVAITDWQTLDPIIALLVGLNILITGFRLVRRSVVGLLGGAIPRSEMTEVERVLTEFASRHGVGFHEVRTREAGRQRFVFLDLLVPDEWSVKRSHDLTVELDEAIAAVLPGTRTFAHVEPTGDPASYHHGAGRDDERGAGFAIPGEGTFG